MKKNKTILTIELNAFTILVKFQENQLPLVPATLKKSQPKTDCLSM
jgi:hypothetical protein